jgi:accessory gene regulator protein AgrB
MSGNNSPIVEGQGVAGVFDAMLSIINTFAVSLIIGAAVLYFLFLGVKYIWLLKNGKGVDEIKQQLPWVVVMLAVMFSSYALIKLIANIFNLSVLG